MPKFSSTTKTWILYIFLILIASVFVLAPSFNLALTGDDYLGLWRYEATLAGRMDGPSNPISYFFIDYGPQDTFTATIHSFVGFQSQYYYFISFVLRFLASLSFLPLIFYLTKNKKAALLSALFFSVCSVGLETTDWSFNMPSYLAIALMNIFLILFFQHRKHGGILLGIVTLLLYLLTIVVQPIRMAFLPFLIVSIELFSIIQNRNVKQFGLSLLRISLAIGAFIVLLKVTSIGMQAGGVSSEHGTSRVFQQYTSGVTDLISKRDYAKLLSPIGQLGSIIIPDSHYPMQFNSYSSQKFIALILIPLFLGFALFINLLKKVLTIENKKIMVSTLGIALFWTMISFVVYKLNIEYPVSNTQLLTTIIGGYFLVTALFLITALFKKQESLYIWMALLLIVLSYLIPWFRNPGSLNTTVGRYLIVSGAGLALFLGLVVAQIPRKIPALITLLVLLFLFHLSTSATYLKHLSSARGRFETEKIRNALVLDKEADDSKTPSVYYFETDNPDQLYHTIMFGFPMFIHFYQGAENPWNIAYTTSWKEVYDSYVDGSGLKRFGIGNIVPVQLEHIHGYKLESGELRDITGSVREKLLNETKTNIKQ